ncbi:hypothetical protein EZV62_006731 [Acer yangbiense]|uniref:Protein kinase domain-containing protein n=1 Tax=Acer yangbiense TaxID=1000413 RepID=A0A5C7IAN5_9ROSI|nr:hypothetical protein EZV62_006731 [Acer yangbiense]
MNSILILYYGHVRRLKIATEVANSLAYLHVRFSRPIVFNGIKPSGILLDENYVAKLFDFSQSKSIPEGESRVNVKYLKGALGYIAPEYMEALVLNEKCDVYNFGGTKDEYVLSGYVKKHRENNRLFEKVNPIIVGDDQGLCPEKEQQLQDFKELALRCASVSPQDRPTMIDVSKQVRQLYRHSSITSGSSYVGQSVPSAVSKLSHLNPSFSRSTQTYTLPSNEAVCGAQWDARNRNFGGVAILNVSLPNQGWAASILGQSDDGVSSKATLSCPAPIPAPAPVPSPSTGIVPGYYDYYPIVWQPPANRCIKANSAGLISNGNPSVTTCGGLFRDSSGKFMGGFSQNLHMETSYFADVMAAILVIEHAYHNGWHNLWLETDSLLVVHLLTYHDVLNLPWYLRLKWIFDVQAKLPYMNFNFTCTFRENNRAAIFMAEIGRHHPGFTWCNIPSDHEDLVKILHHNSNGL